MPTTLRELPQVESTSARDTSGRRVTHASIGSPPLPPRLPRLSNGGLALPGAVGEAEGLVPTEVHRRALEGGDDQDYLDILDAMPSTSRRGGVELPQVQSASVSSARDDGRHGNMDPPPLPPRSSKGDPALLGAVGRETPCPVSTRAPKGGDYQDYLAVSNASHA
jgi:hypothetical protein